VRKKTLEELRASNRARQSRWRRKHKWLGEQRRLSVYGQSEAQKKLAPEEVVTNNGIKPVYEGKGGNVTNNGMELKYESFGAGVDEPYEERTYQGGGKAPLPGVVRAASAGLEETRHERETAQRLQTLVARQAQGRLNSGVEVELEL
jgi:hypothetical protein